MSLADTLTVHTASPLIEFGRSLGRSGPVVADILSGLIGKTAKIPGPFRDNQIVYADYVASGRALAQVEDFIRDKILPFYANSHTKSSYCGGYMTRMREDARETILRIVGGNPTDHAAIFTGSGATAGLNRLVHIFGIQQAIAAGQEPHVLVGPYEHHSNLLPWCESH